MYVWCIIYLCMNLSPAPVVGFGLELAVDTCTLSMRELSLLDTCT